MSDDKMVSHPDHYQSETGMEVIDVIESFTFDLKGIEAICTGNILKYVCRWKKKNGIQDLEKAQWYLTRLIDHLKLLDDENKDISVDGVQAKNYYYATFTNEKEALKVLNSMNEIAELYGFVYVGDYYDLVGVSPTDYKKMMFNIGTKSATEYIWSRDMIDSIKLEKRIDGWVLKLPLPYHLNYVEITSDFLANLKGELQNEEK